MKYLYIYILNKRIMDDQSIPIHEMAKAIEDFSKPKTITKFIIFILVIILALIISFFIVKLIKYLLRDLFKFHIWMHEDVLKYKFLVYEKIYIKKKLRDYHYHKQLTKNTPSEQQQRQQQHIIRGEEKSDPFNVIYKDESIDFHHSEKLKIFNLQKKNTYSWIYYLRTTGCLLFYTILWSLLVLGGVFIACWLINTNPVALILSFGIGAFILFFHVKDYVYHIIVVLTEKCSRGDIIAIKNMNIRGIVKEVGIMSTTIISFQKLPHYIFPYIEMDQQYSNFETDEYANDYNFNQNEPNSRISFYEIQYIPNTIMWVNPVTVDEEEEDKWVKKL